MYRILTEDIRRGKILAIIARYVRGATVYPTTGLWRGKLENGLAIELAGTSAKTVRKIAKTIKRENRQDAVLVQRIQTKEEMI